MGKMWEVTACIAPGVRKTLSMPTCETGEEAIVKVKSYYAQESYCRYMAVSGLEVVRDWSVAEAEVKQMIHTNMQEPDLLAECIKAAEPSRPSFAGEFAVRLAAEMERLGYVKPANVFLSIRFLDVTTLADDPVNRLFIVENILLERAKAIPTVTIAGAALREQCVAGDPLPDALKLILKDACSENFDWDAAAKLWNDRKAEVKQLVLAMGNSGKAT